MLNQHENNDNLALLFCKATEFEERAIKTVFYYLHVLQNVNFYSFFFTKIF